MRCEQHEDAVIQNRIALAVTEFSKEDYDACLVRQELAAEADINVLMRRYAPWELPAKDVFYGDRDYTQDFHEAMLSSREGLLWYQAKAQADPLFARAFPTYGAFVTAAPEVLEKYGVAQAGGENPPPPAPKAPEAPPSGS